MTRPEMERRIAGIPADLLESGYRMVLDGYGAHGMVLESNLTLKQANALHEWHNRYGRIWPSKQAVQS
jgi:predicted nucleotidyltransferase